MRAEFPGLEEDERLQSWNDVLAMLCYSPNAEAGNFERVSFDLAPTLAQYLEKYHPETYQRIIAAPGNVMRAENPPNVLGTPYFHAIMPLLPERDQRTLLQWGRYDTERRFGMEPEGLWLPEMAMNEQTLAAAHEHGYKWTHAFPGQLEGMVGAPTAYNVPLGNNQNMMVLRESSHEKYGWPAFYNGTPEEFYEQVRGRAFPDLPYRQMIVKATDGEHIQRGLDENGKPREGGLVERLRSAPRHQTKYVNWTHTTTYMHELDNVDLPSAELAGTTAGEGTFDNRMARTHGLDRWTGEVDGETTVPWKQELQNAYKEFSQAVDEVYAETLKVMGFEEGQAWKMRDDYIRLLSGEVSERDFFDLWDSSDSLDGEKRRQTLKLLAGQYHKLAASSSCGWFFDKPSGIEPKIVTRQMRIATEHIRTSGIDNAEQKAKTIENELLKRLCLAADEKARLSQVYKNLGVVSIKSLVLPPQRG